MKGRHVWTDHKKWAKETNYPPIGSRCPICNKEFSRDANVPRHIRRMHQG